MSVSYPAPGRSAPVRRQYVVFPEKVDVEAFWRGLLSVRDKSELSVLCDLCDQLEQYTGRPTWRDMRHALTTINSSNPLTARRGWLDALVAAAHLGRPEVGAVARFFSKIPWGDWFPTTETELLKALDEGDNIVAWS